MISRFLILLLIFPTLVFSQKKNRYLDEILLYQAEQNKEFKDPETSPLEKKDLKKFKSLAFYPIDSSFRIKARFVETPGQTPFAMPTTTNRKPIYQKFGEAHFTLEGESITLNLYQSHDLKGSEEYHDYLFLPFTDETNGKETYGGGRYLGLHIPEGDSIIIDFNKAYNPYCAYNAKYSCPIVPKENNIPEEIRAGVKAFKHK